MLLSASREDLTKALHQGSDGDWPLNRRAAQDYHREEGNRAQGGGVQHARRAGARLEDDEARIQKQRKEIERLRKVIEERGTSKPADIVCPITHEPMVDPVSAADGQTYERRAIEEWFTSAATSPLTGEPLKDKTLRPNFLARALRPVSAS